MKSWQGNITITLLCFISAKIDPVPTTVNSMPYSDDKRDFGQELVFMNVFKMLLFWLKITEPIGSDITTQITAGNVHFVRRHDRRLSAQATLNRPEFYKTLDTD
jgi:hypothetical protein